MMQCQCFSVFLAIAVCGLSNGVRSAADEVTEARRSLGAQEQHVIYVDSASPNASLEEGCGLLPDRPCKTLGLGLQLAARNFSESVRVSVAAVEGGYQLNETVSFHDMRDLAIVASAASSTCNDATSNNSVVRVNCSLESDGVGLRFVNVSGISLQNISFRWCGALFNSTSLNFSSESSSGSSDGRAAASPFPFLQARTALFFLFCRDLSVSSVCLLRSRGAGVTIYDTAGTNVFRNCTFERNRRDETQPYPGGGGVGIEFSYCVPSDPDCKERVPRNFSSNSVYRFESCCFINDNKASIVAGMDQQDSRAVAMSGRNHMAFGRGGALMLCFKGNSSNNSITLDNCRLGNYDRDLVGSKADLMGGGLYASFGDFSEGNRVLVSKGSFSMNECHSKGSSGGGVRVEMASYPPHQVPRNNSVVFSDVVFISNWADKGGAVSFVSGREPSNSLAFNSCKFFGNHALTGSAVVLSLSYPDPAVGHPATPVFTGCEFRDNKADSGASHISCAIVNDVYGKGTLYADQVPVSMAGETAFCGNDNGSVVLVNAAMDLLENSSMDFESNQADNGAAMSFLGGASWLRLHPNTRLLFRDNIAWELGTGGAVNALHVGSLNPLYQQKCFLRYSNYTLFPDEWEVNLTFVGNKAGGRRNSIYASSLLPCVWPMTGDTKEDINRVFRWNGWHFLPEEHPRDILTAAARFKSNYTCNVIPSIEMFPGWREKLPFRSLDDLGHDVTNSTVFTAAVHASGYAIDPNSKYVANDSIRVLKMNKSSAQDFVFVRLSTVSDRQISTGVNVYFQPCPPGFVLQNGSCECENTSPFNGRVTCSQRDHASYLQPGACISLSKHGTLIAGNCPFNFKTKGSQLPQKISQVNEYVCGEVLRNRTGKLCGKCANDSGVSATSYLFSCVECRDLSAVWLEYIALEFGLLTFFSLLVIVFRINATSAFMNAFVFFSQLVSLPSFRLNYIYVQGIHLQPLALKYLFLAIYGIWNLDFTWGISVCLHPDLSPMNILSLKYVVAFYPILLILICWGLIELHARNFRPVVWLWRPIQPCIVCIRRQSGSSIIAVFTTFLLLSYCKLLFISIAMLTPVFAYNVTGHIHGSPMLYIDTSVEYFSSSHLGFGLLALAMLLVFVVTPPILLLLYPMGCVQRGLGRCHTLSNSLKTFADIFQGCYKDGTNGTRDCRYFASLYFLLRIVFFGLYVSDLNLQIQYMCQQILFCFTAAIFSTVRPYKTDFLNNLDILCFSLLAIMNTLSWYNYQQMASDGHSSPSLGVFVVNYVLAYIPFFYACALFVWLFFENWISKLVRRVSSSDGFMDDEEESLLVVEVPRGGGGDAAHNNVGVMEISTDGSGPRTTNTDSTFRTYTFDSGRRQRHPRSRHLGMPDRLLNPQNYLSMSPTPLSCSSAHSSAPPRGSSRGAGSSRSRSSNSKTASDHSTSSNTTTTGASTGTGQGGAMAINSDPSDRLDTYGSTGSTQRSTDTASKTLEITDVVS